MLRHELMDVRMPVLFPDERWSPVQAGRHRPTVHLWGERPPTEVRIIFNTFYFLNIFSGCNQVPISGLGPDRDQCPRKVLICPICFSSPEVKCIHWTSVTLILYSVTLFPSSQGLPLFDTIHENRDALLGPSLWCPIP